MKEIARVLMLEASLSHRVALLPPLLSNPKHNPKRFGKLDWSVYYDWSVEPHLEPIGASRRLLAKCIREKPHHVKVGN